MMLSVLKPFDTNYVYANEHKLISKKGFHLLAGECSIRLARAKAKQTYTCTPLKSSPKLFHRIAVVFLCPQLLNILMKTIIPLLGALWHQGYRLV
jgi:hypothetical protein